MNVDIRIRFECWIQFDIQIIRHSISNVGFIDIDIPTFKFECGFSFIFIFDIQHLNVRFEYDIRYSTFNLNVGFIDIRYSTFKFECEFSMIFDIRHSKFECEIRVSN